MGGRASACAHSTAEVEPPPAPHLPPGARPPAQPPPRDRAQSARNAPLNCAVPPPRAPSACFGSAVRDEDRWGDVTLGDVTASSRLNHLACHLPLFVWASNDKVNGRINAWEAPSEIQRRPGRKPSPGPATLQPVHQQLPTGPQSETAPPSPREPPPRPLHSSRAGAGGRGLLPHNPRGAAGQGRGQRLCVDVLAPQGHPRGGRFVMAAWDTSRLLRPEHAACAHHVLADDKAASPAGSYPLDTMPRRTSRQLPFARCSVTRKGCHPAPGRASAETLGAACGWSGAACPRPRPGRGAMA